MSNKAKSKPVKPAAEIIKKKALTGKSSGNPDKKKPEKKVDGQ